MMSEVLNEFAKGHPFGIIYVMTARVQIIYIQV